MGFSSRFRIRSVALLGVALAGGLGSTIYGQTAKTMLVEPRAPLLPASFGVWQKQGDAGCRDCFRPEGQTADVIKEDGVERGDKVVYQRKKGAGTLDVTAFQFGDATGAVSAFTCLRKPGSRLVLTSANGKIGSEMASSGAGDIIFRSGTTVVIADASKAGASVLNDLRQLETALPKIGGPKAQSPLLPTLLPAKGLEPETVRYALGPVAYQAMGGVLPGGMIGFDKSAEVVMAKYKDRGMLTLLLYPTPQIAGNHGRAIEAEMNRQGAAAGTVKLRREGPLVSMTTGAWSSEAAKKMVEEVHLHDVLTWNKTPPPEFKSEVRKTVSLLTSIAMLSGLLALAAIVLGLFFGFGRAAIRVMQGKPAATEPEFLRIDLSGQSAKIRLEGQGEPKG